MGGGVRGEHADLQVHIAITLAKCIKHQVGVLFDQHNSSKCTINEDMGTNLTRVFSRLASTHGRVGSKGTPGAQPAVLRGQDT